MADISTLFEEEKVKAIGTKTQKKKTAPKKSNVVKAKDAITSLTNMLLKDKFVNVVVIGVILGQIFIIYQLVLPSIQNSQNAYTEYKNEIKKINDKETADMKSKIQLLEEKVASLSAQ